MGVLIIWLSVAMALFKEVDTPSKREGLEGGFVER